VQSSADKTLPRFLSPDDVEEPIDRLLGREIGEVL
jgi:hypothetical protein